ncbi:MAG: SpoIID/LytB domain-containing protein [Clostridia bacterium]|nr:SpoIID/LytB domain-containing protein [Clostridia bacterium]
MKNASFCFLFCISLLFLLVCFIEAPPEKTKTPDFSREIRIYDTKTKQTYTMSLEQYIIRCLAAEMPASFHPEALKAQAVAIRGYVCRKIAEDVSHSENADICTDFAHCAAFSTDFDSLPEDIRTTYTNAVIQTENEVLYHNKEIANTVFHAMSSGKTESAEHVWGGKVPYLISVESVLDTRAENYETVVSFSHDEIKQKLEIDGVSVGETVYYDGGTVKEIQIGEKKFSGKEIREKLNLRAAAFSVQPTETALIFTVHGYGHGVGMSQTGADFYAKEGLKYTAILAKYYPGTTLCRLH